MNNILTQNKLVKNLRAYPVLRKRWRSYIRGVRALPEGFTEDKLFQITSPSKCTEEIISSNV